MKSIIKPLTAICFLALANTSYAQTSTSPDTSSSANTNSTGTTTGSTTGSNGMGTTAQQQGTSQRDMEMTKNIRQELMKRDLSTAAQNVTIVTQGGVVTLRGEVSSSSERSQVSEIARSMAKGATVRNELTTKQ